MTHDDMLTTLYLLARTWKRVLSGNNSPLTNAISQRARSPEVGDVVAEWTAFHRLNRYDLAAMESSMGRLVSITEEGGEQVYTLDGFDGQQHRWRNADFVVLVPRFGAWPTLDANPDHQTQMAADAADLVDHDAMNKPTKDTP